MATVLVTNNMKTAFPREVPLTLTELNTTCHICSRPFFFCPLVIAVIVDMIAAQSPAEPNYSLTELLTLSLFLFWTCHPPSPPLLPESLGLLTITVAYCMISYTVIILIRLK